MTPLAACEDRVLIRMAVDGRSECFAALMDRHLVAVRKRLRMIVRDEADLDDLVQEVLLKAWLHLATFRAESKFRTWVIRIGINHAMQSFRGRRRRPMCERLDDVGPIASPEELAPQRLLREEAADTLHNAVARLPRKYRDAIVLHHFTELCGKDTAARLRTSTAAVKTRLSRARVMLSTRLQQAYS